MEMKVEDLVINKYYISIMNGLCVYRKTREYEGRLYHVFEFNDNETLMLTEDFVEKDIRNYENIEGKPLKLNKLRDHKKWNLERDSVFAKMAIRTETKKALLQIEAYKNILMDGIENNKILLKQHLEKIISLIKNGMILLNVFFKILLIQKDIIKILKLNMNLVLKQLL